MKRILESLLIILVVSATAVTTTAAYFTDSATAADNKIVAGQMQVDIQREGSVSGPVIYARKMYPGTFVEASILIENEGDMAMRPSISLAKAVDADDLADYLWLQIWTEGKLWFNNWIKQAPGYTTDKVTLDALAPEEEASVSIRIIMDESTPDSFQGSSYLVDTVVSSYQTNDPAGKVSNFTADSVYKSSGFSYPVCGLRDDSVYYDYDQSVWRVQSYPFEANNNRTDEYLSTGKIYCEILE